jgi:carbon-monoxide dehydrogenase small subunit
MEIKQSISVSRPPAEVWAMLCDVPSVVSCIPGAQLGADLGENRYSGSFKLKVGPLAANIDGEGKVERNDHERKGRIVGRGTDKRGGSRVAVTLDYEVMPQSQGSRINVTANTEISGPLAQIGRTGIIEDVARRLTGEFSTALETKLAAAPSAELSTSVPAASDYQGFDVGHAVTASIATRILRFFRRLLGL